MAEIEAETARHYGSEDLFERIMAGLVRLGREPGSVTVEDIKPVDEFHVGGLAATRALIDPLSIRSGDRVLDIGCGIGGTARFIAASTGATVHGVDLTPAYVETARRLTALVGVDATFEIGSALDLPVEDGVFDLATLIHVGMNIADKPRLFAEARRILRPGGRFVLYEIMRTGEGELVYPVPWAATPQTSFVASARDYRGAAQAVGFEVVAQRARREFALEFFRELTARARSSDGPPPLGLHLLMGETAAEKYANMIANIEADRIAPVEMVLLAQ